MKKLLILALLLTGALTFGQNKNAKTSFEVNGVCEMCKDRIEKTCIKTKGVKVATWNVETHELKLVYNETKTNLETIKKGIANAGHDMKDLKAPQEAYDKLHNCCKYRDEEVIENHKN